MVPRALHTLWATSGNAAQEDMAEAESSGRSDMPPAAATVHRRAVPMSAALMSRPAVTLQAPANGSTDSHATGPPKTLKMTTQETHRGRPCIFDEPALKKAKASEDMVPSVPVQLLAAGGIATAPGVFAHAAAQHSHGPPSCYQVSQALKDASRQGLSGSELVTRLAVDGCPLGKEVLRSHLQKIIGDGEVVRSAKVVKHSRSVDVDGQEYLLEVSVTYDYKPSGYGATQNGAVDLDDDQIMYSAWGDDWV